MKSSLLIGLMLIVGTARAEDPVASTRAALRQAMRSAEAQAKPPTIERGDFLGEPSIIDVRLAVDGRNLAYLERTGGRIDVFVRYLPDGGESRVLSGTESVAIDWASDNTGLWLADAHGLSWFDASTRVAKRIYRWPARRRQSFLGIDPHTPAHALVQEFPEPGTTRPFRYWLIDRRGAARLLHESATALQSLLLRADTSLAFTAGFEGAAYDTVIRRHPVADAAAGRASDHAREILRCRGVEACRLLRSSGDGASLWIISQHGEDLLALQRWQAETGRFVTVHRDPLGIADLESVFWSGSTPLAAAYDRGRLCWEALVSSTASGATPAFAASLSALQRQLPEAALHLSTAAEAKTWLVRAQHETWAQDRYFLYAPPDDRLERLFAAEQAATIPEALLARAVPLHYRGRDGFLLQGYALLPKGRKLREVPLIVWLHGGPVARVHARFDPRLQLLANRGYAVFVPNFRGSDGFGIRYELAAAGDVGNGRVLADVMDGLDFLLAEGIGFRTRQAVIGHSFGGYLSLVAATHLPERFTFALAAGAPTEYGWMKQWQAENDTASLHGDGPPLTVALPQHGYPYLEASWREKMARESPRQNIAALRAPVYLWAGTKDDHVPLKSLSHYAGELMRLRKPVTILIDPDAGHSPDNMLGADAYLYLMEAAAHRHFGGALTPATTELQDFLRKHLRGDG